MEYILELQKLVVKTDVIENGEYPLSAVSVSCR